MRIEFTGRQTEVPAPLRRLGERRLAKLARVLPGITRAHVILKTDRHRQVAEVNVGSPHLDLAAREASADFGSSLAAAFEKLERQARHRVGKRLDRKRRGGSERAVRLRARAALAPPPSAIPSARGGDGHGGAEPAPRVIRSRRIALRPMSVDEAVLELAQRAEGFLLFRDASTERVGLLYRRPDGNLGLLEPEA
jgi:putative sigma-54 modulation protein